MVNISELLHNGHNITKESGIMLQVRTQTISLSSAQWQTLEKQALALSHYIVFESADQTSAWYGFGATAICKPANNAAGYQKVANWLAGLHQQMINSINPEMLAILGSFSFMKIGKQHNDWQKLTNGYFILPRFLIKKTAQKTDLIETTEQQFATADIVQDFKQYLPQTKVANNRDKLSYYADAKTWQRHVAEIVQQIQGRSTLEKVVLARTLQVNNEMDFDYAKILTRLRQKQLAVYHLVLKVDHQLFVSATPERLVKLTAGVLQTAAVAGTAPRGVEKYQDQALGTALLQDKKNRSEQQIVVAEIKRRLTPLTTHLEIPDEPILLKSQRVQHLYTPIRAHLAANENIFTLIAALHPTPALGGYPKEAALTLIRRWEPDFRGLFGAPFGYVTFAGTGEFAVAIRSMLIHGQRAKLFAGAGIVAASDPKQEVQETSLKFEPMLTLLQ